MESVKKLKSADHIELHRSDEAQELNISTFDSLEKLLDYFSSASSIYADTSKGSCEGHQIAKQLFNQLSLQRPESIQPMIGVEEYRHYNDTINRIIDNESIGDINFIRSFELARKILKASRIQHVSDIVILIPEASSEWAIEDKHLIELLIQNAKGFNIKVSLVSYYAYILPTDWTETKNQTIMSEEARFTFGIVNSHSVKEFSELPFQFHALKNGFSLIELKATQTLSKSELNQLKALPQFSSRVALLMTHLKEELANIDFLKEQASLRFSEGAYGVSKKLLDFASKHTNNDLDKAIVLSQLQNIRIALLEFKEAAEAVIPELNIPDSSKANLYQSKAWGLVMCNKPQEAEILFQLAREHFDREAYPRAYFYLLNISALNKLRLGEMKAAFTLEKKIENSLEQMEIPDWHVLYINSINQARLFKKERALDASQAYYKKAFHINDFLRVDSDLVYFNLCMAQLEELKENSYTAFILWLRTCMHWLSMEMPESIAPRVAQAIMKKRLSNKSENINTISNQLLAELKRLAENNDYKIGTTCKKHIAIKQLEKSDLRPEWGIGRDGVGFFTSSEEASLNYTSVAYNQLNNVVIDLLQQILPELKNFSTILIDSQYGMEMPTNGKEILLASIRNEVEHLSFNSKSYFLNSENKTQTLMKSNVRVSPAISHITKREGEITCHFRRYRKPYTLSQTEKEVIGALTKNSTVEELLSRVEDLTTQSMFDMQEKSLLNIYLA